MQTVESSGVSKKSLWAGRIISTIPVLFLLMDGIMKLFKPSFVVEATVKMGYPESTIVGIGLTLTICTIIYVIPRTSILGAILLTGYLGGATATHVRVEGPLFTIIFPSIVALMIWGGLYLRDQRLRALVPFRSNAARPKAVNEPIHKIISPALI
ncbi:MAG TPA: DoxX family protein [Blastocatellia bacterium]|nr:DoxX family protein [Blastocatellia bacterium]